MKDLYDDGTEKYRIPTPDLPGGIQPIDNKDGVDKVIEYQSPYADLSVLLSEEGRTQEIRVYYLKHLRDDWEWVDASDEGVGFVLLKRRAE